MITDYFQASFLAIVQGISEFIPVSSSAHLIILSQFFGFSNQSIIFDVGLHLGSLIAIVFYFRNELLNLRNNKELQEIRRWELIDLNDLTIELAKIREDSSKEFLKNNGIQEGEIEAGKVAILLSGILYLVLRSKTADEWFGINLDKNKGWEIIKDSLESIIKDTFEDAKNLSNKEIIRKK